jgi:Tol biopolymer transport system component
VVSLPARSLAAVLLLAANAAAQRPFTTGDLWAWRGLLDPRISPDGALVAYIERRADRASNSYRSALRIVRTDGSNSVPPRDGPGDDWHPRWSPDASRIAYLSDRTGHTQIYVRPPGNAAEVAIATENVPLNLAWSGDSKTLAYTAISKEPLPGNTWAPLELRPRLQRQHTRLVVVPANGGESKPVILGSREPAGEPVWLADGRGIVLALTEPFDPDHPLEGAEIYLLQSPAWTPKRLSNHPGPDTDPIASPDGSRIAWLSREPVQQSYVTPKLWAANSDGSRARALAGALDRDPVHPAWSSDSRTVYFVADDRGESRIYGARNDGSVRTVLSAPWLSGFSLADNGKAVAVRAPGELIVFPVDVVGEPVVLAAPNRELIAARTPAAVEKLEYRSGARTIDAWLTLPVSTPPNAIPCSPAWAIRPPACAAPASASAPRSSPPPV